MKTSKPTARYFAQLCVNSYSDALIAERGWRHREADVEILFDRAPWGITYTWRGTSSVKDAIRDLRLAFPWYDRDLGWCAAGALKGVRAIWPALETSLRAARDDGIPIYHAGHSLGGAEASIAAGMVAKGWPCAGLFTIGAAKPSFGPRLGEVLDEAGVPRRRIVADGDPIPGAPPGPWWDHPCQATILEHAADLAPDHPSARYLKLIPEDMPAFAF